MNTSMSMCSYGQQVDISKGQLVRANIGKCVLSKWHVVLGLNSVTNDTLNLPGAGCCGAVNTLEFQVLIESPKGMTMKGSSVIKKKVSKGLITFSLCYSDPWIPKWWIGCTTLEFLYEGVFFMF